MILFYVTVRVMPFLRRNAVFIGIGSIIFDQDPVIKFVVHSVTVELAAIEGCLVNFGIGIRPIGKFKSLNAENDLCAPGVNQGLLHGNSDALVSHGKTAVVSLSRFQRIRHRQADLLSLLFGIFTEPILGFEAGRPFGIGSRPRQKQQCCSNGRNQKKLMLKTIISSFDRQRRSRFDISWVNKREFLQNISSVHTAIPSFVKTSRSFPLMRKSRTFTLLSPICICLAI